MILVVCALPQELRHWKPRAGIELLAAGVGPVEAASATARALALAPVPPRAVLSVGIAGGFPGRAAVGDALAIERESLAELGLESEEPMPPLPGGALLVDRVASDPALVALARACGLRVGSGVTVSTITTSAQRAANLVRRFNADIEAMEGFAVLRAAQSAGVPALELRGISNLTGPRADSGWDFEAGAHAAAAALDRVLDAMETL